ncbi:hypothetical protein ACGFZH_39990 [Streptomyces zaomyceticus]|uniref:hypothetical protein n=1 Tax=Streptomyces zaomyceticus TaxID=68286 RepID=UPI0037226EC5
MARVLAVGSAYGAAAEALNSALGLNPGPGTTHSWDDVREAVADIAVATLVALDTIAGAPEHILAARLEELAEPVPGSPLDVRSGGPDGHWRPARTTSQSGAAGPLPAGGGSVGAPVGVTFVRSPWTPH